MWGFSFSSFHKTQQAFDFLEEFKLLFFHNKPCSFSLKDKDTYKPFTFKPKSLILYNKTSYSGNANKTVLFFKIRSCSTSLCKLLFFQNQASKPKILWFSKVFQFYWKEIKNNPDRSFLTWPIWVLKSKRGSN